MKTVIRSFVCGFPQDSGKEGRCTMGDANCNNYCNHDHSKPMAKHPKTYETIVWEERDIWKDIIEEIAGWLPTEAEPNIYDCLIKKYEIKFKSK